MTDHSNLAMSAFLSGANTDDVTARNAVTPRNAVKPRDPTNPHFLKFCFVCEEESKPGQVSFSIPRWFRGNSLWGSYSEFQGFRS